LVLEPPGGQGLEGDREGSRTYAAPARPSSFLEESFPLVTPPIPSSPERLSPVLLLGAGRGEATCGILYLAGYLRRNGIEASVRLCDFDETDRDLKRSLEQLVSHVKPRVVGISLKWYLHVHRALVIARHLRSIDPAIRIVLGGNTAALWWRELLAHDCVDDVVLGDGEVPFLALCQGDPNPPNCARRGPSGTPAKAGFGYVQNGASEDVYYSHFKDIFLSQLDLSGFSGWVAPGKGCDQSCVYCGGRRAAQRLSFGRANPFLRSPGGVQKDHREIGAATWQFRYDFPGGSTEYLCDVWPGLNLKQHSTTYFLWGVPRKGLVKALAQTFDRVALVLDIGCFSQAQRLELMGKGVLKPCPTDDELFEAIADCLQYENLQLEVSGIAGLPHTTECSLAEEEPLVHRMLEAGCEVSYQRLQAQPGALVTEHGERFDMVAEAVTFDDFVSFFAKKGTPAARRGIPMVRFRDGALEQQVTRNCERLDGMLADHAEKKEGPLTGRTKVKATVNARRQVELGAWLGAYKVPPRLSRVPVTVLRSANGAGLACAPSLHPKDFEDPMVQQADAGSALLSALEACARPVTMDSAVSRLMAKEQLEPESAEEVLEHLLSTRFLQRA